MSEQAHQIVVVGGGAGGLELATRLGDTLGKHRRARVTLVDAERTSLWKPLLHQVAAGSLDPARHGLDYLAQAQRHHFEFRLGRMEGIDRARKLVHIAQTLDEQGEVLIPRRTLRYDTLVLAVGSTSHDFGTPGAAEHALRLDSAAAAQRFHRRLVDACVRASLHSGGGGPRARISVAIIGAGATGVELAAELRHTLRELVEYGRNGVHPMRDIDITIVEAGARALPLLPERLSAKAIELLARLRVAVRTGERVTAVEPGHVRTASGTRLPADLVVWAAGIQAPPLLAQLDGLAVNRLNQLVVTPQLQTSHDPDIYAIGDCAACTLDEGETLVPPRAQAAHQQAKYLAKALRRRLRAQASAPFRYRDFGSLVSLGGLGTVGGLMSGLTRRGSIFFIEGQIARFMYLGLYKKRELALNGLRMTLLATLARWIERSTGPRVKLH
jgi:NADH dehydrogenase